MAYRPRLPYGVNVVRKVRGLRVEPHHFLRKAPHLFLRDDAPDPFLNRSNKDSLDDSLDDCNKDSLEDSLDDCG